MQKAHKNVIQSGRWWKPIPRNSLLYLSARNSQPCKEVLQTTPGMMQGDDVN